MKLYTIHGRIINSLSTPDRVTKEFTELASRSVKVKDLSHYQVLLSKLKLRVYQPNKCAVEAPGRDEVESQLSYIASQKFYKVFGSNASATKEYVAQEIEAAMSAREQGYAEIVNFFDQLEADKAAQANQQYLEEYNKAKAAQEAFIAGDSQYVANAIEQLFNSNNSIIDIPFLAFVQIDYHQAQHSARVDVEIPLPLSIPTEKSSISPTYGHVSLKQKLVRERDDDFSKTIIGMAYYFASHVFNLTANIQTVDVSVWELGKTNAYLFIRFDRWEFSLQSSPFINPLQSIFDNSYVCDIKIVRGGTHISPIAPSEFKQRIAQLSFSHLQETED